MGSPFPRSKRATAYLALVEILKADPYLSRMKTWRIWDGSPKTPNSIVDGECPAIRLTVGKSGGGWQSTCDHDATMDVKYEIFVKGNSVVDLMDADEAVVRALFPIDQERADKVRAQLWEAGTSVTIKEFAILDASQDHESFVANGKEEAMMTGSGIIELSYSLET